jgi:hypothetical protein
MAIKKADYIQKNLLNKEKSLYLQPLKKAKTHIGM